MCLQLVNVSQIEHPRRSAPRARPPEAPSCFLPGAGPAPLPCGEASPVFDFMSVESYSMQKRFLKYKYEHGTRFNILPPSGESSKLSRLGFRVFTIRTLLGSQAPFPAWPGPAPAVLVRPTSPIARWDFCTPSRSQSEALFLPVLPLLCASVRSSLKVAREEAETAD